MKRVRTLVKAGFLCSQRPAFCAKPLYVVTRHGTALLKRHGRLRGLGAIKAIDTQTWEHDLIVTDVRIDFEKYTQCENWISETLMSLSWGGNIKHRPYAFTQEGVAMLSSVLRSARAIQVNTAIMRAFVRLREAAYHHRELTHKLAQLEDKIEDRDDDEIRDIFEALHKLMDRRPISLNAELGSCKVMSKYKRRETLCLGLYKSYGS
jgi:hypothetical protein